MSLARFVLALGCLLAPVATQTLTMTTPSGTVPRIPPTPFIPGCPTTPEPYYFAVSGTITPPPAATQEIRLLVRPTLLDGTTIPGCTWVSQCQRGFVLPDNSFVIIGQFGTNNVPRSWFSGQRADVQFALIDRTAGVPACITNPAAVSIAVSSVATINVDPLIPTLHDFAAPCTNATTNVTGTPTPGQSIQFVLPSPGAVVFGLHDTTGFPFLGCRAYFSFAVPLTGVSTDATGTLSLPIPVVPSLVGANIGTQGARIAGGPFDLLQPTLVSIR